MFRIVTGLAKLLLAFGRRSVEPKPYEGPRHRPTLAELPERFAAVGLSSVWRKLKPYMEPSLRIWAERGVAGVGVSKLGGAPDLPPGFEWPCSPEGRPLAFLGQINLREVAALDPAKRLPPDGMLAFFYDEVEWVDPNGADQDRWRLEYLPAAGLSRAADPWAATFAERPIRFELEWTLPVGENLEFDQARLTEPESEAFVHYYLEGFLGEEDEVNRLFGHADLIQGDPRWSCELVSRGILSTDSGWSWQSESAVDLAATLEWVLLAQIDSDYEGFKLSGERFHMCWGDAGRLYFWIRRADLAAHRFDRVRLTWDCS